MNSAVARVLNSVLGDWVENLNAEQLKISVFSGKVELSDLKLKSDVLNLIGFPLELQYGLIGHLSVDIPWTALTSSPLEISISDVFALLGPRRDDRWNDEEEKAIIQKAKQSSLNQYEALSTADLSDNDDPGFTERLVTKIVDNVQITLKSIYVRYQDDSFGMGIALGEAAAYTCNENWERMFVADSPVTYKQVKLEGFKVFLDYGDPEDLIGNPDSFRESAEEEIGGNTTHKFLIEPTGFTLNVEQNKDPKNLDIPQITAALESQDFKIGIENKQIQLLMKFNTFLSTYNDFKEGVRRSMKDEDFTSDEAINYRQVYKQWSIINKSKDQSLKDETSKTLQGFEAEKQLGAIIANRKIAHKELKLMEEEEKARELVQDLSEEPQQGMLGRVGSYFSWKSEADEQKEKEERLQAQKDAEKKLQDILRKKKDMYAQVEEMLGDTQVFKSNLPSNYIKFLVDVRLPLVSLCIKSEKEALIAISMAELELKSGIRPSSLFVNLKLSSSIIEDCLNLSPGMPNLLSSHGLDVSFDQLPSPKLRASTSEFSLYINLPCLVALNNAFIPILSQDVIISYASEATKKYVEAGQEKVAVMIQSGVSLELDVNLKAPVICFPVNARELPEGLVVIDLGELMGSSGVLTLGDSDVYDDFEFMLQNIRTVRVMACSDINNWKDADCSDILQPMNFKLNILKGQTNPNSMKIKLDISSAAFVINEDLVSFAVSLVARSQKEMELMAKPPQKEIEEEEEIPNTEVVESEAYKDMLKKVESSPEVTFDLTTEKFSLVLSRNNSELAVFTIGAVTFSIKIAADTTTTGEFQLSKLSLIDCRESIAFRRVLDSNFSGTDTPLLYVKFRLDMKNDKMDVKIRIEDIHVEPHPGLFMDLQELFTSQMGALEALKTAPQPAPKDLQETNKSRTCLITKVSFILNKFEIWLPLDIQDAHTPVGCLRIGLSVQYLSNQEYEKFFTKNWQLVRTEFLSNCDRAQLDMKHVALFVGFPNHDISEIQPVSEKYMIEPCRFTVSYKCLKNKGSPSEMYIETDFESIVMVVGFKDVKFFTKTSEIWSKMQPPKKEVQAPAQEKVSSEPKSKDTMEVIMRSDALQLSLVDDSSVPAHALIHTNLSSMEGKISMGESQSIAFGVYLIVDFYNANKGVWEPLIEPWDFKIQTFQDPTVSRILVEAEQMLLVNLTLDMAIIIGTLLKKLGESTSYGDEQAITRESESLTHGSYSYSIQNTLGVPFSVWLDAQAGSNPRTILPGGHSDIGQDEIDKLFLVGASKHGILKDIKNTPSFSLCVGEYSAVNGLRFEKPCVYGFLLDEEVECVMHVYSRSSKRIIDIQSSYICYNSLDVPVCIECINSTLEIPPGSMKNLPFEWIHKDLCIKDLKTPDEFWSNSILEFNDFFASKNILKFKTSGDVLQKCVWIAPIYTIKNSLPCTVTVMNDNFEIINSVLPGTKLPLPMVNKQTSLAFKMTFESELSLTTDPVPIEEHTVSLTPNGNFPASYIMLEKRIEDPPLYQKKKLFSPKEEIESYVLELFAPYIIVNRTQFSLQCGTRSKLNIGPNKIGFHKTDKNHIKVRTNGDDYGIESDWSKEFNIMTVGVSGLLELDNSECKSDGAPKELLFGVQIVSAPSPLERSKILYIVPRFQLQNYVSFPIFVRQKFPKSGGSIVTKLTDSFEYQFENSSASKWIQLSVDGEQWSSAFSIEEIEDFQVKIPAMESEKGDPSQDEWYRPQPNNNFCHVVRVIITTEDQATLFISIVQPGDPEFMVSNRTPEAISVKQGDNPLLTVEPMARVPWVFDDHIGEKKLTILKSNGTSVKHSIEKVKAKDKSLDEFRINVIVQGVTRILRVRLPKENLEQAIEDTKEPEKLEKSIIKLRLEGLGVSIIDRKPAEKLFFSISGVNIKFKTYLQKIAGLDHLATEYDFVMEDMQLDNMKDKQSLFPVIFCKAEDGSDEPTPFIQFKLHKSTVFSASKKTTIDKIKWIELLIQEVHLKINFEVLMLFQSLATDLQEAFLQPQDFTKDFSEIPTFMEVSPLLDVSTPVLSTSPSTSSKKAYFEFIRLCGVKIVLTFKTPSDSDDADVFGSTIPFLRLFAALGSAMANISDSPLKFNEILMQSSFQTISQLTSLLVKNYAKQGVFQFYKILGSSDLIGNPIGLIDKLGTGVFEFVSEPSKGMLKGPKAFAEGVGKGVRSLVGNVVSGGFGAVSKISGSLYGIVRKVGGDEKASERIDQTDNAIEKVGSGFTGGARDLIEGFTGIFTKPWKGAQKEGAKGFFKGVGSGLIGLVVSPLSAALRIGNGITSGITDAASLLAKGKIHLKGRRRFPRFIDESGVIELYNSELAQAQELLNELDEFRKKKIVFYLRINERQGDIIIILTMTNLLYLVDTDLEKVINIAEIYICEVDLMGDRYYIVINTEGGKQLMIESENLHVLAKLYCAINLLPNKIKRQEIQKDFLASITGNFI